MKYVVEIVVLVLIGVAAIVALFRRKDIPELTEDSAQRLQEATVEYRKEVCDKLLSYILSIFGSQPEDVKWFNPAVEMIVCEIILSPTVVVNFKIEWITRRYSISVQETEDCRTSRFYKVFKLSSKEILNYKHMDKFFNRKVLKTVDLQRLNYKEMIQTVATMALTLEGSIDAEQCKDMVFNALSNLAYGIKKKKCRNKELISSYSQLLTYLVATDKERLIEYLKKREE